MLAHTVRIIEKVAGATEDAPLREDRSREYKLSLMRYQVEWASMSTEEKLQLAAIVQEQVPTFTNDQIAAAMAALEV
jgi:hypothetical protein